MEENIKKASDKEARDMKSAVEKIIWATQGFDKFIFLNAMTMIIIKSIKKSDKKCFLDCMSEGFDKYHKDDIDE